MMHRHCYEVPQLLLEVAYLDILLSLWRDLLEMVEATGWIELKASTAHIWLIDVSATVLVIFLTVGL
jgi:hypothetical protein